METPSAAPSPTLWQTLPDQLLALLTVHHVARLLALLTGPQVSPPNSTELLLDLTLIHLGLAKLASGCRPGWTLVETTPAGDSLGRGLVEIVLPPLRSETTSAPTPTPPSTTAASSPRASLSLVHCSR